MLNFTFKVLDKDHDLIENSPKVLISFIKTITIGWCLHLWFVHGWSKMG
jgi:hypothetical protein